MGVTVPPGTTFYHVNQPHVDLVYLNGPRFQKGLWKNLSLLNPLASDLEFCPKLKMPILPSYCHTFPLMLALKNLRVHQENIS